METRAQVIIHTTDEVAENFITNSWAFSTSAAPSEAEFTEYTQCFRDFYNAFSSFMPGGVAQNGHEVKYYELGTGLKPNYPWASQTFGFTVLPSTDPLPSEVALCLSFQGPKVPGFPQARRRGRVYLGPIRSSSSSAGRPNASIMTSTASAAVVLCQDLKDCTNAAQLGVWSVANNDLVLANDGWVDNSWDTQRRRGLDTTARTTWAAP